MQNSNEVIEKLTSSLYCKMKNDGNITPTLNNIYDTLLQEYPKIKTHSECIRTIIIKNLKNFISNKHIENSNYTQLFVCILSDFLDLDNIN